MILPEPKRLAEAVARLPVAAVGVIGTLTWQVLPADSQTHAVPGRAVQPHAAGRQAPPPLAAVAGPVFSAN